MRAVRAGFAAPRCRMHGIEDIALMIESGKIVPGDGSRLVARMAWRFDPLRAPVRDMLAT